MNPTSGIRPDPAALVAVRRAALEDQMAQAIRRAQKQYVEMRRSEPSNPGSSKSPHLGKNIDLHA